MKEIVQKINQLFIMTRFRYINVYKEEWRTQDTSENKNAIPLNDSFVKIHLEGKGCYGVFSSSEFTKFLCFDVDVPDNKMAKWTVYKIKSVLNEIGFKPEDIHVSTSGNKGYHVDLYFNHPIKNYIANKIYKKVLDMADLNDIDFGEVEYRPNLLQQAVKLPLGKHHKTGNRCWYVDEDLKPITNFEHILSIKQVDVQFIYDLMDEQRLLVNEYEVIEVDSMRHQIENKVKSLDIYRQNIDPEDTIEAIEKILNEGLTIQGSRHVSIFKIAKYFRYQGFNQDETEEMLKEWMNQQDKNTYTTKIKDCYKDIEETVRYIYEKEISLTTKQTELIIAFDEMKEILKLRTLNQKILAYCVMIHSKRYGNAKGVFYMTYKQMAESSSLSYRTTQTLINELEKAEIIEIIERNRKSSSSYKNLPNIYKFNYNQTEKENEKQYIIKIDNDIKYSYSDTFNECMLTLFDKNELRKSLPRRQYQSILTG